MPLSVALETERGEQLVSIEDRANILHRLLPPNNDSSCQYLQFIDWYGDTVFYHLHMKPFLEEWARLKETAETAEETALIEQVAALARRCQDELHLYLKFYGD
jgi:hypothetical protein